MAIVQKTGSRTLHQFPNGYGASVISSGYGSNRGMFEVAVVEWVGKNYELTYSTPITNNVLGWLTAEQVDEVLPRIEALPARTSKGE